MSKKIAVIGFYKINFQMFLEEIHEEDRDKFVFVDNHTVMQGMEFSDFIRLNCSYQIIDEVFEMVKIRVK